MFMAFLKRKLRVTRYKPISQMTKAEMLKLRELERECGVGWRNSMLYDPEHPEIAPWR